MPIRAGAESAPGRSFSSLLAAYLAALQNQRTSHALQERASRVLPRFFSCLDGRCRRDLRGVGEAQLVAFARHLSRARNRRNGKHLSPTTQCIYLDAVRAFFRFLLKRGAILTDPAAALPRPRAEALPRRVLSETQARRLMNAPPRGDVRGERDRAILETLYGTGIRRGECLRLEVTDVDLGQELLFVRNGKGKRDRIVPFSGRAAAALDLYLRERRPELLKSARQTALFLSSRGGRLTPSRLARLVQHHARMAGISGPVFPHALRHSYGTHLLKGKADVRHIQELLGHSSLETTALYTRVDVEDLRQVLARAHPRERLYNRRRKKGACRTEEC